MISPASMTSLKARLSEVTIIYACKTFLPKTWKIYSMIQDRSKQDPKLSSSATYLINRSQKSKKIVFKILATNKVKNPANPSSNKLLIAPSYRK